MAADVATSLVREFTRLVGPWPELRIRAWDGSEAGPIDGAPVLLVRSRSALRHLLWQPGELGLARAFVAGELDIDGDPQEGLRRCWAAMRQRQWRTPTRNPAAIARLGRLALRLGVLGPRPPIPAEEARLRGTPHTRQRDRQAISHHYDLGNSFYQLILDSSMAYSCAYWSAPAGHDYGVADAQSDKLDLICRKLDLRPGGSLLLQQMSRGERAPGGGAFIERYIAPDMTMRPLHRTIEHLERAHFEVREVESLREHYVRTVDAWAERLRQRWDDVVTEAGLGWARVWRLYLAGGALAFDGGRMGVDQIVARRSAW